MRKAFLINSSSRCIEEITIDSHYSAIYSHIGNGCTCFAVAAVLANNDTVYVDDNGLFSDCDYGFMMPKYYSQPLIGNAVILGCDEEGGSTDVKSSLDFISQQVLFLSRSSISNPKF